jgi:hypothetical protein
VNERIADLADDSAFTIICGCYREDCADPTVVPKGRLHGRARVGHALPREEGHVEPSIERVVHERDGT